MSRMTAAQRTQAQHDAREIIRKYFPAGCAINASVVHASSSGMSRRVQVHVVEQFGDGATTPRIREISGLVARAIGARWNDGSGSGPAGVVVSGAGFDAAHDVAYSIMAALGDGRGQAALESFILNRP